MARFVRHGLWSDQSGNSVEDGQVTTFKANSTALATVYSSSGASTALSGSVTASGSDGNWLFWIDTTDYDISQRFKIQLSKVNFTSKTYDDIVIFPAIDISSSGSVGLHGSAQSSTQNSSTGETTGFTANAGSTNAYVSSSSTFTGNYGTSAYTISDVVASLKKHGMITT